MDTSAPLPTQAQHVCELLRADIVSCKLVPDTKLNIAALAEDFSVSLGAVREALSRLSSEGLVLSSARRGFRVSSVSRDELFDLTNTRVDIESLCLSRSIALGDLAWESRIVASMHTLGRLDEAGASKLAKWDDDWMNAHIAFHESLVRACGSPCLLKIREDLFIKSERYRRLSLALGAGTEVRDVPGEHQTMATAALARDAALAIDTMKAHFLRTADILIASTDLQLE
jgi:DNA-binding GntR family transcriptional regulator